MRTCKTAEDEGVETDDADFSASLMGGGGGFGLIRGVRERFSVTYYVIVPLFHAPCAPVNQ